MLHFFTATKFVTCLSILSTDCSVRTISPNCTIFNYRNIQSTNGKLQHLTVAQDVLSSFAKLAFLHELWFVLICKATTKVMHDVTLRSHVHVLASAVALTQDAFKAQEHPRIGKDTLRLSNITNTKDMSYT